jgi:HD superfamily phosphohydrolase
MSAEELFAELQLQDSVSQAIATVDALWTARMEKYHAEVGAHDHGGKAIKDAVWGMIELQPEEVVMVGSPMLQRLRRIRQLGVSFLTYPTAGYSRFEHTLGALHQSERMVRAVGQRSGEFQQQVMDMLRIVRLASLLHDVGHLPLSHIGERYYSRGECPHDDLADTAEAIRDDVATTLDVPRPQLSECLSVITIATPCMNRVLEQAGYKKSEIARAALAIVGRSWSPQEFFVTQIISNVVDADKLDYMFRDGFVTRVPLAVDLERLLYKLEVVQISASRLPAARRGHIHRDDQVLVLGTSVAGDRLAYEVAQARTMLFERVYFHHKTRAAERVALRGLAALKMHATELLAFDDSLFAGYGAVRFPKALADTAERLEDRRLPRRVFAISTAFASAQMLEDLWQEDQDDAFSDEYLDNLPPEQDDRDVGRIERLAKRKINWLLDEPSTREGLERSIVAEIDRLGKLLGKSGSAEIWVDTPARPPGTGDAALVVVRPDGSVGTEQGYAPEAAAETYEPLHIAYVFLDDSDDRLSLAYVACELALAERTDLAFDRNAADYAKVDYKSVEDCKRAAEQAASDLFFKCGYLRPTSQYAHSAAAKEKIEKLATRFHKFSTDREVHVDSGRIRKFLDQFPERLVSTMLDALGRVKFLDRNAFSGFAAYLDAYAPENAVLVPLTSAFGKSADHLPYFFADQQLDWEILPLNEALERDDLIVIYDDLLLSGTQSEKILRTWAGERRHVSSHKLDTGQFNALRERLHSFAFGWAWELGVDHLRNVAAEFGLTEEIRAQHEEAADQSPLLGLPREQELRAFLADVGESLLMTTRGKQSMEPWDQNRCAANSLGYGNSERLVVTEYNAPAGTVTALWKHGAYRRQEWMPLFPRRRS